MIDTIWLNNILQPAIILAVAGAFIYYMGKISSEPLPFEGGKERIMIRGLAFTLFLIVLPFAFFYYSGAPKLIEPFLDNGYVVVLSALAQLAILLYTAYEINKATVDQSTQLKKRFNEAAERKKGELADATPIIGNKIRVAKIPEPFLAKSVNWLFLSSLIYVSLTYIASMGVYSQNNEYMVLLLIIEILCGMIFMIILATLYGLTDIYKNAKMQYPRIDIKFDGQEKSGSLVKFGDDIVVYINDEAYFIPKEKIEYLKLKGET
ncbi:MAG: hypothetical protein ACP5NX_04375 [Candidatus Bilamarchaeaceae archaeon]